MQLLHFTDILESGKKQLREGITKIHLCEAEPCVNSAWRVRREQSFRFEIEGKWRPEKNFV